MKWSFGVLQILTPTLVHHKILGSFFTISASTKNSHRKLQDLSRHPVICDKEQNCQLLHFSPLPAVDIIFCTRCKRKINCFKCDVEWKNRISPSPIASPELTPISTVELLKNNFQVRISFFSSFFFPPTFL